MIKKIIVVAMATVMVVAAQATFACDTAKNASAAEVSATSCTAHGSVAGQAGCCAAKRAACAQKAGFTSTGSQYLCAGSRAKIAQLAPFSFMKDADPKDVNVSVEYTDNGFALVFTGVNESNIDQAMVLANQSMDAIGKPAACEYTRAGMIESAGGCEATKACLSALANCTVAMVEIEGGAKTVISSETPEKIKELHGVLAEMGLNQEAKQEVKSESE